MLQLRNAYGQIDIASIDPLAVSELSDSAQAKLASLISAVEARSAAQERFNRAVIALREAQTEQGAALEAHKTASDPFPFNAPKVEDYGTRQKYDEAMQHARQQHEIRVRSYRENEARKAVVAAYNSSH